MAGWSPAQPDRGFTKAESNIATAHLAPGSSRARQIIVQLATMDATSWVPGLRALKEIEWLKLKT
jgi:hypothetical protein